MKITTPLKFLNNFSFPHFGAKDGHTKWPSGTARFEGFDPFNDSVPRHVLLNKDPDVGSFADWCEEKTSGLTYDPVHDEFFYQATEVPKQLDVSFLINAALGFLSATSLLRALLKTRWGDVYRVALSNQLFSTRRVNHDYSRLRSTFVSTVWLGPDNVPANHSHGKAASIRGAFHSYASAFATAAGLTQYSYQMSRGQANDLDVRGFRTYYWSKDTVIEPRNDNIKKTDLIVMVDVDYYIDMNHFLANNEQPVLLYTLQPEHVGYSDNEYEYSFDTDNVLTMSVRGGAVYKHQIWNYSVDVITVVKTRLGVPVKTVVYDVTMRRLAENRFAVLLVPMSIYHGVSAIIMAFMQPGLMRLQPSRGDYVILSQRCPIAGYTVSVTGPEMNTAAKITKAQYDTLLALRKTVPKNVLTGYHVKSILQASFERELLDKVTPFLVAALNSDKRGRIEIIDLVAPPTSVMMSFDIPDVSDRPNMVPFMNPLIPPAYVASTAPSTSSKSIQGRITSLAQEMKEKIGEFKMTRFKQRAVDAFVGLLVPERFAGTLVPYDYEDIDEKQDRPSQKRDLLDATFRGEGRRPCTSFVKKEAYGKLTDPRNITTFPPCNKIPYAAYMYPIMDYMKQFPFYAFGKPPIEVAQRVADICSGAKKVVCPDTHRMDGCVIEFCRKIERSVGLRLYNTSYQDGFAESHELSYGNKVVTSDGEWYSQGFTRGSGEMGTSVWNTILNLFTLFYAKALEYHAAQDPEPFVKAFNWLEQCVIAGGDDGLASDISIDLVSKAGAAAGFLIKCPEFTRGDVGVNFLARVYGPLVWNGDLNSMCSIKRQLAKFHLTPAVPLSNEQKLLEKAISFYQTDRYTPVIAHLCSKAIGFGMEKSMQGTRTLRRYGDDWDPEEQYPNEFAEWFAQVAEDELQDLVDVGQLITAIVDCNSFEELMSLPPLYELGRERLQPGVADEGFVQPTIMVKFGEFAPVKLVRQTASVVNSANG